MTDFLLKDYDLKARFLEHHFEALWKRFGLFLAIQSGLLAVLFSADRPPHLVTLFCGLGAATSLLWFLFGLRDRDLVGQCRGHVKQARQEYERARELGEAYALPPDYPHPGQTATTGPLATLTALRPGFSIAAMGVWVPVLVAVVWAVIRFTL